MYKQQDPVACMQVEEKIVTKAQHKTQLLVLVLRMMTSKLPCEKFIIFV